MAENRNFSPAQQKIIKRYYAQGDTIHIQKLAELTTDLYLAEGKKKDKLSASERDVVNVGSA